MSGDGVISTMGRWRNVVVCAVVGAAVVGVVSWRAVAELPREIRVVTYNIHHGEGMDKKFGLERIAKVVMAVKPDIVALQEVDQGTKRASGVDQPAEFARLMRMEVVFGRNIPFDGGGYGTAGIKEVAGRAEGWGEVKWIYYSKPKHKEERGWVV